MQTFHLTSENDLPDVVGEILPLVTHKVILLRGDLGAGKTTFIKNFVASLGSTETVTSPTYSIVNEYDSPRGKIYHFDLYRLNSIEEVYDIGMLDYLESGAYCLIEWPEIFQGEIGHNCHEIDIFMDEAKGRILKLSI